MVPVSWLPPTRRVLNTIVINIYGQRLAREPATRSLVLTRNRSSRVCNAHQIGQGRQSVRQRSSEVVVTQVQLAVTKAAQISS